jgi:hypothetical protein
MIVTARPVVSIGDEIARWRSHLSLAERSRVMPPRRHFTQMPTLEYRLTMEAANLRKQAEGLPPGVRREELMRKPSQVETASHMSEWLSSPKLQPLK